MDIYYVGEKFVDEKSAVISVNDLAVLRGYGVFDFLRTYNGVPFHLRAHLERLQRSARQIGLLLPKPLEEIDAIVRAALQRSKHAEKNIRIVITGGLSDDGITPGTKPQLLVMINEVHTLPEEIYRNGAKVVTNHVERFMPGAKSISYIPAILGQQEALAHGAIESVYVDRDGYLLEGTTSNFFAVIGQTIITPPCDRVLAGVTRQVVINLAKEQFTVTERRIHKDELRCIDEAFLSSSVREVAPIVTIDAIQVGSGTPGPVAVGLQQLFREYADNYQGRP